VPTWVLRDPSVSWQAKALLALLCTYADRNGLCWPSNTTLAGRLGVTSRAIRKWMAELLAVGAVTRERQFKDGLETVSATKIIASRGERTFLPGGNQRSHRTTPVEQHQSEPTPSWSSFSSDPDRRTAIRGEMSPQDSRDENLAHLSVEDLNKIVFGNGQDPAV
jgi:hypothetical protein